MRVPVVIIKASLIHLYLARIRPFGDGNGRTARLCECLVVVTSGDAASGPKTPTRDLNQLVSIGLVPVVGGRYRAESDVLMSLLPLTVALHGTASTNLPAELR